MDVKNLEASKAGTSKAGTTKAKTTKAKTTKAKTTRARTTKTGTRETTSKAAEAKKAAELAELLRVMSVTKASDLHLKVGKPPVLRINGRLDTYSEWPEMTEADMRSAFEVMTTEEQREAFDRDLELDFAYMVEDIGRFRVNAHLVGGTIGLVLRAVATEMASIEELGLPEVCRTLIMYPHGLVAVTGPTGSGKSTTLASMIDYLNKNEARKVITIEDPIEYLHRDNNCVFCQRELGFDTRSFAGGLKAALRQDLDVILVGEMRDGDTAAAALTAAETGHLVLTTLQTAGACRAVERMIDMFPPHQQHQARVQLAMSLQGVLYQVLVPTADGTGRVPAVEVLLANAAVRNLIREGKTYQLPSILQTGSQLGMQNLDHALIDLVGRHVISEENALARCDNVQEMKAMLTKVPRHRRMPFG
jgi:twitching motility protein PilT